MNTIKDIVEKDIKSLAKQGWRMKEYSWTDNKGRKRMSEVTFLRGKLGSPEGLSGCSYMSDMWTEAAMRKIAKLYREGEKNG